MPFDNSLSSIPMFDTPKDNDNFTFRSTYRSDFTKKQRPIDNPRNRKKELGKHTYDFKDLSERLIKKDNGDKGNNFKGMTTTREEILSSRSQNLFNSKSLNDFTTESHYSFSGFGQNFKRPNIPEHIKRDNHFQTNSERSIKYLKTHDGLVIPFFPGEQKTPVYIRNPQKTN